MGGLLEKALEHAIALFFEAVADPVRWPAALDALARAVDSEGALIFSTDPDLQVLAASSPLTGLMDDYMRDGWHGHNPRSLAVPFQTESRFIADHELLKGRNFDREPYYQEFLKPHGLMWGAGARLWLGEKQQPVILTLERTAAAGQFSPADLDALDRARVDLVRALTLSRTIGFRRLDAMLAAWETVNQAVALVNGAGRLIRATRTFSAAIGDGLLLRDGRLVTADPQETAALDAAILATADGVAGTGSTSLAVRRPTRRAPIVLDILPVTRDWEHILIGTRALILLRDPARVQLARPDLLRSAFSLSRREAELATLLTRGLDLGEAAEQLGVARPTVRSQLAALFSKTGTRRQAELVALLTRYATAAEARTRDAQDDGDTRADHATPID
ncbi:helix-turn-helix transcriptional regulator [Segnochrobactraceae bacterium EtOH-i3]